MRSKYEDLLTNLYAFSLCWAYESSNTTEALLSVAGCASRAVDPSGLQDFFELWTKLVRSGKLPVPATDHILPYHFSKWNRFKGEQV